jgi:signal transduction histidine kinase
VNPFVFTFSGAAIASLFAIAAAVFFHSNKRDYLTQQYILYLIACIVWLCGNVVADTAQNYNLAFIASGIAFSGGAFVASFFLTFVHAFLEPEVPLSRARTAFYLLPGLYFTATAFSTLSIKQIFLFDNAPSQVDPGLNYPLSLCILLGIILFGLWKLFHAYKISTTQKQRQIVLISIGFIAVFCGQLIFTLILPLLGILDYYNVAPQFTAIFALATGYAIFKHQLLDVKVVIQRGVVYTVILTLIVGLYATIVSGAANFYQNRNQTVVNIALGSLAIIISLLTVPRLDRFLRRITDPIFFSDRYTYQEAVRDLSTVLHENTNLEEIILVSEEKLTKIFRAEFVSIGSSESRPTELIVPIPGNHQANIFVGAKRSGARYTDEDTILLQTFANQAAIAIGRALLFREVKERADELEKRVESRTREIKSIQESQRSIMLQLSHNLQTPLAILLNSLERLRGQVPSEQFSPLELAVKDVSYFITRLLRLARLESGQEPITRESVDVSSLVIDIVEEVSVIAESKEESIIATIEPILTVNADAGHLREAFLNILSNALKYSDGVSPITVGLTATKEQVVFTCRNMGSVINVADRQHIFTPFYRSKGHEGIAGTGLGLATTKQIIDRHEGQISVTSTKRFGTCFTISLPRITT